jgi:glutamyl-tRNA synthetase
MEESAERAATGERHVVRFKSPDVYPSVDDIVHGNVNMQIQINASDKRYDDPVLLKSDGLPTYHLANVVDDHYMKITHVIRGDEWLASTPKHLALYDSFGWKAPHFCHIPLLTSLADKKLSKRSGDTGLADLAASGFLPEALVNFVALYGWSPVRTTGVALSEEFSLARLEKEFSLDGLTRGNAKVDRGKLKHFNSIYFRKRLLDPAMLDEIVAKCLVEIESVADADSDIPRNVRTSRDYISRVLRAVHDRISTASELMEIAPYFFTRPDFNTDVAAKTRTQLDKDLPRTFDRKFPSSEMVAHHC